MPVRSSSRTGFVDGLEVNLAPVDSESFPAANDAEDGKVEHTELTKLGIVHDILLFLLDKGPEPETILIGKNRLPSKKSLAGRREVALARASQSKPPGVPDKTRTKVAHARRGEPALISVNASGVPQTTPEPPLNPSYYLTVTGVEFVSVTRQAGNTNTQINDTFALRVPNVSYDLIGPGSVFVSTPADKTYTFSFRVGSDPISLSILKGIDNITPSVAIRYRDAIIPAGATATLRVTPSGIEALQYDTNNDGIIDGTVTPTSSLVGSAAADTTAPR